MQRKKIIDQLNQYAKNTSDLDLKTLFLKQPERADYFHLEACGLFYDFSKQKITQEIWQTLQTWADIADINSAQQEMLAGAPLNFTEQRAALHIALRDKVPYLCHNLPERAQIAITQAQARMMALSQQFKKNGAIGNINHVTDVVHLGIGGSDLGPRLVYQALKAYHLPNLKIHFVSNLDAHDIESVLAQLNPQHTIFIVASKTFLTLETRQNALIAKAWLEKYLPNPKNQMQHFFALTQNESEALQFGIDTTQIFPLWDWVGGRFSLWSAIGLPLMLGLGETVFKELLAGAHAMDRHFIEAPLSKNMPIAMALVGVWNSSFLGYSSLCIAPYHQWLSRLPAYLQQLEMESNGKTATTQGTQADLATCPALWGEVGTCSQHAYFQWLHQSEYVVPVDFIAVIQAAHQHDQQQQALLANCLAQSEALMIGKSTQMAFDQLTTIDDLETRHLLAVHKTFPGNRPSSVLLLPTLDAYHLGAMIALYEHKVFVQSVLWQLNPFDQWGVELGKSLAQNMQVALETGNTFDLDASSTQLIKHIRKVQHKT